MKTRRRYHLTLVALAIIKKAKGAGKNVEKVNYGT